jgi:hypothetical protein
VITNSFTPTRRRTRSILTGDDIVVRDVLTENEDHAAWLVATKVGVPAERVTVWAGREP